LIFGKIVQPAVKIIADPPDCPGIGLDCFWLIPRKFQVLTVFDVKLVELGIVW
jgi:hypothetical protein